MTPDITLTLIILTTAVILFVTEWLRMDVVALLVLGALALSGLVTPGEALSGFSNPAVVTVWAVFILSGGLARTGVASILGRQILRLAGSGEMRLIVVIMLTAALMSAFMNNVGVAALLLPVVMDIARRTGRAPSRLLMPLAFGALLGGLNTLIGTPPNILISDALRDGGLRPFSFFDFTPVGLAVTLAGVAFMALVGCRLLPTRDLTGRQATSPGRTDLEDVYNLIERVFIVHLPAGSALADKTLAESRLGAILGLNVLGVIRNGRMSLAPAPDALLHPGDRLLVQGRLDRWAELQRAPYLEIEAENLAVERLTSTEVKVSEVKISPASALVGRTLEEIDFRNRYGSNVLAIRRNDELLRRGLQSIPLQPIDSLLVQGARSQLNLLRESADFLVSSAETAYAYRLHERLLLLRVPEASTLVGKSLVESHLGDALDLIVVGIVRQGQTYLTPAPQERLQAGDLLLVEGKRENLLTLSGLQELEMGQQASQDFQELELESDQVGLAEVVLSPHTTLAGKTLRQLHFRDKYGLSVLSIWRGGRAYRSELGDMALQFGDAFLVYGPRTKLSVLGSEPDFLVLTESAQEPPLLGKAPLAALLMAAILIPVLLGWLPIAIAAVVGATLMVLTGCLTMEEAYRSIEWRAVFLIAGMLPLGIAMEQSGAASLLAEGMVAVVGQFGPLAVIAGLYLLATLATQVMPNPAVAVLLAPIALTTAQAMAVSPYALMMAVALAASASFLSPVAHPANVLIMGPGCYRFSDYIKVGLPLTLVTLAVTLLALPLVWPLTP